MRVDDKWMYGVLRRSHLAAHGSEVDLSEYYENSVGTPAVRAPVWRQSSLQDHMAKAKRFLGREDADALTYAGGLLMGVLDRVFPPFAHSGGARWPLPVTLLNWPYCEWLLHAETDYEHYKDHIIHSLRVAAIGRWLIGECNWASPGNPGQGTLAEAIAKAPQVKVLLSKLGLQLSAISDRLVLAAWWIASLFHDIGYGFYLFGKLERHICEAFPWYAGDAAAGLVRGCRVETLQRSLFQSYLEHLSHEAQPWSPRRRAWEIGLYESCLDGHSAAGAVLLLMALDETWAMTGYVRPELELILHLAAEAAFYHDLLPVGKTRQVAEPKCAVGWGEGTTTCSRTYRAQGPLAAILALCDRLQCWGRLSLRPRPGPYDAVLERDVPRDSVELELLEGDPPALNVEAAALRSNTDGAARTVDLAFLIENRLIRLDPALHVEEIPCSL
ncbi:MAG: hypothetical protein U9R79_22490 [Armatimonadota bacterium]|nr:hypothetical protein [Armatimonadota bacterium]